MQWREWEGSLRRRGKQEEGMVNLKAENGQWRRKPWMEKERVEKRRKK